MAALALEAEGVLRRYRNGRGVGPVSLGLRAGEVLALLGPNGSGKTTLLRCLATRSRPRGGEVRWFGDPDPARARPRLAVVFDATAHVEEVSGEENLRFFARARKVPEEPQLLVAAGLAEVGGEEVANYSYGMRRRLLIAEALVGDPALLVLDEPTLGLDVEGRNWLELVLRERQRRGWSTLLGTNDTSFVEEVATRVGFLVDGRLVADSPLADLLASLGGLREVSLRFRGEVDLESLRDVAGVRQVVASPEGALVLAARRDGLVADILGAVGELDRRLVDLSIREPGLAECFLQLTGRPLDG
ncbi:MAG: ABC transporter ATP-binding protein [Candidatus Dormibacteraeota bacterium]|nr:ABC transporter ATP-binding protein [Candidatus Dormibacteraeota bacterium]